MNKRVAMMTGLTMLAAAVCAGAVPISCFVVHADPTRVDDSSFASLVDLVARADLWHVPLTILLTAQWAELILADPAKVAAAEGFVARGHEIGAHHHAYWATQDRAAQWDGYTNTALDRLTPADRLRFRGTMSDYWQPLSSLPGTQETACMGLSDEDAADWICDLRYSTFGQAVSDAISEPTEIVITGCAAIQIRHALLVGAKPGELAGLYALASDGELFAVIAHVSDYADQPSVIESWFQLLAERDPDGARRMTVAGAVKAWTDD